MLLLLLLRMGRRRSGWSERVGKAEPSRRGGLASYGASQEGSPWRSPRGKVSLLPGRLATPALPLSPRAVISLLLEEGKEVWRGGAASVCRLPC